jgi:hypothetical protein
VDNEVPIVLCLLHQALQLLEKVITQRGMKLLDVLVVVALIVLIELGIVSSTASLMLG